MDAYHWKKQQEEAAAAEAAPPPAKTRAPAEDASGARGGDQRKRKKELKVRYRTVSRRIDEAEARIAALKAKLADPVIADDHQALWDTQKELDGERAGLEPVMAEWEALVAEGAAIDLDLLSEAEEA